MKLKPIDLIAIHNNIARRKNLPQIPAGAKLTVEQLADRLIATNSAGRQQRPPILHQQPIVRRSIWGSFFRGLTGG